MYETVLVAVDGSEESLTAAREAVELAADGGSVHALSVVEQLPMYKRSGKAQKFEDDEQEARGYAEDAVSEVQEVADSADVDCVTTIEEGLPRQVIVSYAEETDTEAIVLGKRGLQDVADDLLGSTAERVIRNASVPVVTVPDS